MNLTSNLMLVCGSGTTGCHGWIETHRAESISRGWLVFRGTDPATVPIKLHDTRHVLLDDLGTYTPP